MPKPGVNGLLIKGGEVVTACDRFRADVYCEDGVIRAVGPELETPTGAQLVDASGRYVLPGGVDPHVHMELPVSGTVSADDFFTGTAAAVAGGTTTVIDFISPNKGDSLLEFRDLWREKASKACADYGLHAAVTSFDERVRREMEELFREDGVSSFKIYMAYAIGVDDREIIGILETAKALGALVMVHAEHGVAVEALQRQLLDAGLTGPRWHPVSRPCWIEAEATARVIMLARLVGTPLYIVHCSCRESLDAIDEARRRGQPVYGEVCPHHLLLDDSVYDRDDFEAAAYVLTPPLRPRGNGDALWSALESGLVQTVATDHCPFRQADQKTLGRDDFTRIPNGAAGVEDRMALMFSEGVARGRLTLEQLVAVTSTNAAKRFHLYPRKGAVRPGADADLVLIDPQRSRKVSAETSHHAVDRSIYEGFVTEGAVTQTILGGRLAWNDGDLRVERGAGRYLPRRP